MRFQLKERVRVIVFVAAAVAALSTVAASSASEQRAQRGFINVGISTTLSGAIATLGQGGLDGVQLAVDDLNQ